MHRNWFGTLIIELLKSSNKQVRKTCHERDCCQGSWPYQIPNNGLVKTWYNWGSWYHFWKCQFIGKAAISIIMIYEMFVEGPSEVVGLYIYVCVRILASQVRLYAGSVESVSIEKSSQTPPFYTNFISPRQTFTEDLCLASCHRSMKKKNRYKFLSSRLGH